MPFSLSVLIPVYNYDPSPLLDLLEKEVETFENERIEILLGDDASAPEYTALYQKLAQRPYVRVVRTAQNGGAGAMRNRLAREAQSDLLLCLDSDITPLSPHFIRNYLEASDDNSVVMGGHVYTSHMPEPGKRLHFLYGSRVESRSASDRARYPYKAIGGVSFLIPRSLLLSVPFDEEVRMGYEDALWGAKLKEKAVPVRHIDNPVRHELRASDQAFLASTRCYIDNLYHFRTHFPQGTVRLWDTTQRFALLIPFGALFFSVFRPLMEHQLCGTKPSLKLFSLYKWSYLCHTIRTNKRKKP